MGRHSTGFQGTLYGNKHSISNGTVAYQSWICDTNHNAVGLFHYINGGKVYDLSLESTLKLTMATKANVYAYIGTVAARTSNATLIGITSNVSSSTTHSATDSRMLCSVGGMVGETYKGTTSIIKCNYNGNLYFKTSAASTWNSYNDSSVGGMVGRNSGTNSACLTINQCSVTGNVEIVNHGGDIGGIIGSPWHGANTTINITDIVLNVNVRCTDSDGAPGMGMIFGYAYESWNASRSTISNIYILGGKVYANKVPAAASGVMALFWQSNTVTLNNINCPVSSGVTAGSPSFSQSQDSNSSINKKGSTAAVVTEANKNSAITNNFSVSSSGTVTSKLSQIFVLRGTGQGCLFAVILQ